jgi:hypothetical protein
MARKVIVFQHNPWEGPEQFLLSAAKHHKIKMDIIRVWEETIPVLRDYMAMILLGGRCAKAPGNYPDAVHKTV